MNTRIAQLRKQSLGAAPSLSEERAVLITEYYNSKQAQKVSAPVRRAEAFLYFLQHKTLFYQSGELIVGERGPKPGSVPTYPEITLHSLEDLEILHNRDKVSYKSDEKMQRVYVEEIIPFWEGNSNRDKIFAAMDESWKLSYEAGIFTEFQEQRAPGHTVLGNNMFKKGFIRLKQEIAAAQAQLDFFNDSLAYEKKEELKAMDIAAEAIMLFAKRYQVFLF